MVKYNPKAWVSLIFDVYSQHIMRVMFPLLGFVCIICALINFFLHDYLDISQYLSGLGIFHSLLGVVLGLFLVLRTNTAYDRWWEGRKIWGALVNDTRMFATKVGIFLPSADDRHFFNRRLSNFVLALKEHLRSGVKLEELELVSEEERAALKVVDHKPNALIMQMYARMQARYAEGKLSGHQLFVLDKEAKLFSDHLGMCERIKKTPIPHAYSLYIKKFIFMYSITLPFSFISTMGYWSLLPVAFIFYVLVSLELIAEEIEDPFGTDLNDLPLEEISRGIKANVFEILVSIPESKKKEPKAELSA